MFKCAKPNSLSFCINIDSKSLISFLTGNTQLYNFDKLRESARRRKSTKSYLRNCKFSKFDPEGTCGNSIKIVYL